MTDASLLYICSIKQHKENPQWGGIDEILHRFAGFSPGEGITRKSQFFLITQHQGFTPHELASLRRKNFFLTYFKH